MPSFSDSDFEVLRNACLVTHNSAAALARHNLQPVMRNAARNSILIEEGHGISHLLVLTSGRVEFSCITPDGDAAIVDLVRPTRALLLPALLAGGISPVQARALDRVGLLQLSAEAYLEAVASDLDIAISAARAAARDHTLMTAQLKALKTETSLQRFCRYLLNLRGEASAGRSIRLPFSKRLTAGFLSMTPATLSRILVDVRGLGVEVSGSEVRITDASRLNEVLGRDPL